MSLANSSPTRWPPEVLPVWLTGDPPGGHFQHNAPVAPVNHFCSDFSDFHSLLSLNKNAPIPTWTYGGDDQEAKPVVLLG